MRTFGMAEDDRVAGSANARFCFFLQAEEGIRVVAVTGVQTCALPISDSVLLQGLADTAFVRIWNDLPGDGAHRGGRALPEDVLVSGDRNDSRRRGRVAIPSRN